MISKTKGFTLIELMIVVAIIGILGAVFFGAITNQKRDSEKMATTIQLRDMADRLIDNCPSLKPLVKKAVVNGISYNEYEAFSDRCTTAEVNRLTRELQY